MKSIFTRVWEGTATATDGDGNTVKVNVTDIRFDHGHAKAALALCAKMGWDGKLQGGIVMQKGLTHGMVWTWVDEVCQIEAPKMAPVWLKKGLREVGCTVKGRPTYRWASAWRVVNAKEKDLVQPYFATKAEAVDYIQASGNMRLMGVK